MENSNNLQIAYNHLYEDLRRYIWGISVVDAIADLEIACYKRCPSQFEVRSAFTKLKSELRSIKYEDEELSKSLDTFEELIDNADSYYYKLDNMEVVIQ